MKVLTAIKKIEKLSNQKVQVNKNNQHFVTYKGKVISFYPNGRMTEETEITCVHVKNLGDESDSMIDYFPGYFCDNLTQAFKRVDKW